MNNQDNYLKDCPFCGQRPEVELAASYYHYSLRCINEHCAAGPKVVGRTFDDVVEKWNNRVEEGKNTKFITKLNSTDIEVVDIANGSRKVYRFDDGSWWMIDGPDDPHVYRSGTK